MRFSDTYSHIDALCHVAFEGSLSTDTGITSRGAAVHGIEALKDGLVGRGVLLDIPRLRGTSWLEPGEHVLREELMVTIARDLAPWSSVKFTRYTASSGRWPGCRSATGQPPGTAVTASLAVSRPPDRPHSSTGNLVSLPAEHERHQRTP